MDPLRGGWTALLVIAASCLWPGDAGGQSNPGCIVELRGGIRPAGSHTVANGNPFADMERGVTAALGGSCPVGAGWRLGSDVESNAGPALWLWHVLATGERRVWEQHRVWAALRAGVGWAFSTDGYGSSHLVLGLGSGVSAIEQGVDGPAFGLGVRGMIRASSRLSILLDGGWRGSLLQEIVFDRVIRRESKVVHAFPVTLGLGLRL